MTSMVNGECFEQNLNDFLNFFIKKVQTSYSGRLRAAAVHGVSSLWQAARKREKPRNKLRGIRTIKTERPPPFGQNLAENKGGSFRCGRCPFLDLASESDLEPIITLFTGLPTPRQLSDTNLRSPKIRAPENKGGSFSFNCTDHHFESDFDCCLLQKGDFID